MNGWFEFLLINLILINFMFAVPVSNFDPEVWCGGPGLVSVPGLVSGPGFDEWGMNELMNVNERGI
jgi:hypothetical protein